MGTLFVGFMLTPSGPKVLEYNVRFGDPETEALMLLLSDSVDLVALLLVRSSFYYQRLINLLKEDIYQACAEHRLDSVPVTFKDGVAVTVILASQGYPGSYPKGKTITIGAVPSSSYTSTYFITFGYSMRA